MFCSDEGARLGALVIFGEYAGIDTPPAFRLNASAMVIQGSTP